VQVLIPILIVVALVALIGAVLVMRRKSAATNDGQEPAAGATSTPTPAAPGPEPMSDLESALAQVTDSTGRPIQDRIDAETDHVDELRVPDDTGPLLRRALDHVAKPDTGETELPHDDGPSVDDETPPAT
jgi:hypothetical protein